MFSIYSLPYFTFGVRCVAIPTARSFQSSQAYQGKETAKPAETAKTPLNDR